MISPKFTVVASSHKYNFPLSIIDNRKQIPNNIYHVYTHIYQYELKISQKCAMLDVIVFGDLNMGGHTYLALSE